MENDNGDDMLAAVERHDRLLKEYRDYRNRHGSPRSHSDQYCMAMLIEVLTRIKSLEKEPEDAYQSRAAALLHWNELLALIKKRLTT